jgi:segregation and condensation protein B
MDFVLKDVLKALLFSTSEPLSIKDVQAVVARYHEHGSGSRKEALNGEDGADPEEGVGDPPGQEVMRDLMVQVPSLLTAAQIRDCMSDIGEEMDDGRSVTRLVQGPKGYRISVSPDYAEWVRLLRDEPRPQKLSPASMETLAIIAYRQPVTRSELESIRGVSSDSALNTLMERELVIVTGRAELPGRPIQYGTTGKFLETCGLRSVEELPASDVLSPNQLSEWIRRATTGEAELSDADMGLPGEDVDEV